MSSSVRRAALAVSLPLARVTALIPTRNERENIERLLRRLLPSLPAGSEVLFVDDSDDGTPEQVAAAAARLSAAPVSIAVAHRSPHERAGGLGTAVLLGLRRARHRLVCVMDADLQHPPETVGRMLAARAQHDAECVVASRYCAGGDASGLAGPARDLVSRSSTTLARGLFPRRLRRVSDPMSGMFLVDRDALELDRLRPRGFKVLLEILVTSPGLRVAEVGYAFADRHAGASNAGLREGLRFCSHILGLRTSLRSWTARRAPAPSVLPPGEAVEAVEGSL